MKKPRASIVKRTESERERKEKERATGQRTCAGEGNCSQEAKVK